MIIYVDKDTKAIIDYSINENAIIENCDTYEVNFPEEYVNDNLLFYRYSNGELNFDMELEKEVTISRLREKRGMICFPIVNRGQVWYNALSTEQLVELQIWYQAWLDVTKTLIEPERPIWIK